MFVYSVGFNAITQGVHGVQSHHPQKELSVVDYGATCQTFKPKFKKFLKIHSDKISHVLLRKSFSYISKNGTFQLQD